MFQQYDHDKWAAKLKQIHEETGHQCCKRNCLNGGIPVKVLKGVRDEFCDCHDQVERKRLLRTKLDSNSKTSYSLNYGAYPVCWKALQYISGASSTLLQSVVGSPKARFLRSLCKAIFKVVLFLHALNFFCSAVTPN